MHPKPNPTSGRRLLPAHPRAGLHRWAGHARLIALTTLVLGLLAWARGDTPAPGAPPPPEGRLIADQGQLGCLSAGRLGPAGAYAWVFTPVTRQAARLEAGEAYELQPLRRYVETPAQVDALRLGAGGWAIVSDVHGGGTRLLQYARVPDSPFTRARAGSGAGVRLPELITELRMAFEPGAAAERQLDLFNPRLLERDGRVYLVGSSKFGPKARAGITWIAEAVVEDRSAQARKLADGVDARVARIGSEFFVAVRELGAHQTLAGAAVVHLYRSADLQTWTSMGRPGGDVAFHSYDLRAGLGALWLAGSVDAEPPAIRVFRVNIGDGRATEAADRLEPVSATAPMQFDPGAPVGETRPPLVLWRRDGLSVR